MIPTPFPDRGLRLSVPRHGGFSLVEVTLVIGLMLGLAAVVIYSVSSINDWRRGREAAEKLRSVYIAQKSYLADHPAKDRSTLTAEELIPYLPGNANALPTHAGLAGESLTLDFKSMPPVFRNGSNAYDPSGSNSDGLWDVGTH